MTMTSRTMTIDDDDSDEDEDESGRRRPMKMMTTKSDDDDSDEDDDDEGRRRGRRRTDGEDEPGERLPSTSQRLEAESAVDEACHRPRPWLPRPLRVATIAMAAAAAANVTDVVSPDHAQHLRLLEALVFAGTQALDEKELADRLPNDADVAAPAGRSGRDVRRPRRQPDPGGGRLCLPYGILIFRRSSRSSGR